MHEKEALDSSGAAQSGSWEQPDFPLFLRFFHSIPFVTLPPVTSRRYSTLHFGLHIVVVVCERAVYSPPNKPHSTVMLLRPARLDLVRMTATVVGVYSEPARSGLLIIP